MRLWIAVLGLAAVLATGCGEDDLTFPGAPAPTNTPAPASTSTPGPTSTPTRTPTS